MHSTASVGELVDGRLQFRGVVESGYRAADVLTTLQHGRLPAANLAVRGRAQDAKRGVDGAAAAG